MRHWYNNSRLNKRQLEQLDRMRHSRSQGYKLGTKPVMFPLMSDCTFPEDSWLGLSNSGDSIYEAEQLLGITKYKTKNNSTSQEDKRQ